MRRESQTPFWWVLSAIGASIGPMLLSAVLTAAEPSPGGWNEAELTTVDREHWSFRPLAAISPPVVDDDPWSRTPVDRFILANLRRKQLPPAAEADRATLIRRLTLSLTGLPPSPEEVNAFVADAAPDAYERLVERLLGSPAYGERWAQHWLDLARFAETDGYEHDKVRATAWKYRDWVVDALNQDLPYDRFVQMQLAGDELLPGDETARQATGFCLAGPDMPDINSQEERKHVLLNEMTSTVGAVFLGLQLGCAQCHDHKYDPISIGDFYRLRACFEPSVQLQKDKSVSVFADKSADNLVSHVYLRGDWRAPGSQVDPAFPRIANPWNDRVADARPASSEGRRLALAKWLTRDDHPLTSRVMVNRVWQFHFGRGLSATASDFGLLGDEPLHGELLDWLATEFVRRDWSLKTLHRLIVLSATYRQSSRGDRATSEMDPENRYFGRFNRQRLSGETLRDAMYSVSETLTSERGGPGVMPPLPKELMETLLKDQWKTSPREADHYRRSVYLFARRNLRFPLFEVFDRPDANTTCPERNRSTTAPQSLYLLNSQLSLDAARRFAGSVLQETEVHDPFVRVAFLRALGREPSKSEQRELEAFVADQEQLLQDEGRSPADLALPIPERTGLAPATGGAYTLLCLAIFNLNEFLYLD